MNKYNFDDITNRRHTDSIKWKVSDNELPLWVADMDFHVLPEIKEAIINKANIDSYGYSLVPDEFFDSYIKWNKKRHDVQLKKEWLIYSNSVLSSLDVVLKRIKKPNGKIIMLTPIYNTFYSCIKNNDLSAFEVEFAVNNYEFTVDFEALENALKDDDSIALLLCNPHNPIGKIFSKDELIKIDQLVRKYNKYLLVDEIHGDIALDKTKYNPIISVDNDYEKLIFFLAPSKTFNLASVKSSVMSVIDPQLHELMQQGVYQDDVGEPNYFSCVANIAAYEHGEEWVNELNDYLSSNKACVIEFLNKEIPEIKAVDIKATYLMWLDISLFKLSSDEFIYRLRKETGLFILSGSKYGKGGEGFIRMNIATNKKTIDDALNRLKTFCDSLR